MPRVDHWADVRDRKYALAVEPESELLIPEIPELPDGPSLGHRYAVSIAAAHGMTLTKMLSHRRKRPIVYARWHAMFVISERTRLSMPQIGKVLGGIHPSTVLYGIERHRQRIGLPTRTNCASPERVGKQMNLLRVVARAVAFNEKLWSQQ
jgi:hypothetical protein